MLVILSILLSGVNGMITNQFNSDVISIVQDTPFPMFADHIFNLQFSPRYGDYPAFSMLMFLVKDEGDILESAEFYPGIFPELPFPFNGQYFQLLSAKILPNNSIHVEIKYNKVANNKHFEVRYGEYESREKMLFAKNNWWLNMGSKYTRNIQLYVRTKLTVHTETLDGRKDGVMIDEPGYLYCKGTNGIPPMPVYIGGDYKFRVLGSKYESETNERRVKVRFTFENHNDTFHCYTRNSRKVFKVKVFHHPRTLHLNPRNYGRMPNGSNVQCVPADGYPYPEIEWKIEKAPLINKPEQFFTIFKDRLFLLGNAPIGSEWAFRCIATNVIPNSRSNSTSILYEFYVIDSNSRAIMLAGAIVGSIVILIVLVIVAFVVMGPRRKKTRNIKNRNNKIKSGNSSANKELGFDADTAVINSTSSGLKQSGLDPIENDHKQQRINNNNTSTLITTVHADSATAPQYDSVVDTNNSIFVNNIPNSNNNNNSNDQESVPLSNSSYV